MCVTQLHEIIMDPLPLYHLASIFTPSSGNMFSVVMVLKKMYFRKSPSQHPKTTIPGLNHQYFETQHRWSRWPIATNSCIAPGIFSHQKISILSRQSIKSFLNHIFPTVLPIIFKRLMRDKNKISSQMWIYIAVEVIYIFYSYALGLYITSFLALKRDEK